MRNNLNELILLGMSSEFEQGKSMEEIWKDWVDEEKIDKEGKSSYKDMIGSCCCAIGQLNTLLKMKALKNDPKNRMYIINKIEEYLNAIKKYTEEELRCK